MRRVDKVTVNVFVQLKYNFQAFQAVISSFETAESVKVKLLECSQLKMF